ncbi:MAG: glucosyl transferase [Ignavibacterium sp.]|nr:glucosyl transferase [Ignavibacterium sp.]
MTAEKISQKTYSLFLLLIFLLLLLLCTASCNTIDPPPDKAVFTLTLEDVSCTEAWITLTTNNLQLPTTINLLKDNTITKTISLQTADTLLYIDSLLPNQTYKFHSVIQSINHSSNEISVITMDTTSHAFTFQTWTFGTIGSSSLYDAAIISENNIWCVGEILVADSSPNGYTMYNAVHWDGNDWNLKRIFFPTVCGSSNLTSYPAKAIFAFDDGQIWISSAGDKIAILENGVQVDKFCLPSNVSMSINKIWGTSGNDLYVVGNGGNIAHYNGSQWTKIESGTSLPIRDIWGDFNTKTNKYEILAVAAEIDINMGSKVLRIEDNSVTEESNIGLSWDVGGIWFKSGSKYYVAGAGIHYKHSLNDSIWNRYPQGIVTNYTGDGIRGNNVNDVFATGSFLEIAHFNGVSWHNYFNVLSSWSGVLGRPAVKGNLMVAGGSEGSSALVVIGRRN